MTSLKIKSYNKPKTRDHKFKQLHLFNWIFHNKNHIF